MAPKNPEGSGTAKIGRAQPGVGSSGTRGAELIEPGTRSVRTGNLRDQRVVMGTACRGQFVRWVRGPESGFRPEITCTEDPADPRRLSVQRNPRYEKCGPQSEETSPCIMAHPVRDGPQDSGQVFQERGLMLFNKTSLLLGFARDRSRGFRVSAAKKRLPNAHVCLFFQLFRRSS